MELHGSATDALILGLAFFLFSFFFSFVAGSAIEKQSRGQTVNGEALVALRGEPKYSLTVAVRERMPGLYRKEIKTERKQEP